MNELQVQFDRAMQQSGEERKNALLDLYKETRYRECAIPVICLVFLRNMLTNPYEADYHLFRHYILCGMPHMASEMIEALLGNPAQLSEMLREYPIEQDDIAYALISGDLTKARAIVRSLKISAREPYEAALLSMKYDAAVSESFMHHAMSDDIKQNTHLFLLYLKDYMTIAGKDRGFALSRSFMEKHRLDNNALLYRLAVTCEDNDPSRARGLYSEIIRSGVNYLDTEERMNKLTNSRNGYKIKNTDEDNNDIIF